MLIDPGVLADADQILAAGEPDFDRLIDMVREERGEHDHTQTTLVVVGWLNSPVWERDMLIAHLAVAMVRLAEAPDAP